jgi:hypothetical protein
VGYRCGITKAATVVTWHHALFRAKKVRRASLVRHTYKKNIINR